MHLTKPTPRYKESFLQAYQEFLKEGMWDDLDYSFLLHRFDDYVKQLLEEEKGLHLPISWVPHTQYWIIEDDQFAGLIDLRHRITDPLKRFGGHIGYEIRPSFRRKGLATQALKSLLEIIKKEGKLDKVLITCDKDNTASRKVIESNGGVYKDEIQNEGHEQPTLRFWVTISKDD